MKKYLLILMSFCCFFIAAAQNKTSKTEDVRFNKVYTATSDSDVCEEGRVSLKVCQVKQKLTCTINVNTDQLKGYLIKDHQKVNQEASTTLYQFFRAGKKTPLLFVRFYNEQGQVKAMLVNPGYLDIFKPCFDKKGIELTLKDQ
ncbi:hypothetical protein [Pedobacter nutrimenti]|uniref:NlpE-like protein n=1 Tax=Pedobacter nutrimenti TaxID=1241337 RepID=A0A318UK04_9SPHI|nr:hypothetical protein [Pedobacter nutrimenti]PYF75478.1 hypothetical protein B0O44_10227 [Pedobacter nutrimenti]